MSTRFRDDVAWRFLAAARANGIHDHRVRAGVARCSEPMGNGKGFRWKMFRGGVAGKATGPHEDRLKSTEEFFRSGFAKGNFLHVTFTIHWHHRPRVRVRSPAQRKKKGGHELDPFSRTLLDCAALKTESSGRRVVATLHLRVSTE